MTPSNREVEKTTWPHREGNISSVGDVKEAGGDHWRTSDTLQPWQLNFSIQFFKVVVEEIQGCSLIPPVNLLHDALFTFHHIHYFEINQSTQLELLLLVLLIFWCICTFTKVWMHNLNSSEMWLPLPQTLLSQSSSIFFVGSRAT